MLELEWEPPGRYHETAELAASAQRTRTRGFWQDGLTLALTAATFICVAANVQSADWVDGVPPLFPIATGVAARRVRPISPPREPASTAARRAAFGAPIVYFEIMALLAGGSLYTKTDHLLDRMYVWWSAVTQHGTSADALPVIVIMLAATWLGSFVAAWTILRWKNAVLGLLPGRPQAWDAGFRR